MAFICLHVAVEKTEREMVHWKLSLGAENSEELESDMHNQFPLFKSPLQAYLLEQASLNYFLYHLVSSAGD